MPSHPASSALRTSLLLTAALCAQPTLAADFPLPGTTPGLNSGNAGIATMTDILPEDVAFALQVLPQTDNSLLLMWDMPQGYYLYRKSLVISTADGTELTPELPPSTPITDEFFGATAVWFDKLLVHLPASQLNVQSGVPVDLLLTYQGCAQDAYCYPPVQKAVSVTLP